ncbi:MAG TPA: hypothetical protein VIV01_01040 [Hyphomicrobiaceae bacterium]|jgi:hypothetical protein
MAVGVTDRLWEVADIVTVLEDWEESNLTDYIGRHWRGEQNVVWSLLVNCIAVPAATLAGAALLAVYGGVPERVLAWGIPVYLVWFVWALVGTVRAAIATFRNRDAHWVSKIVAIIVFVGLVPIAIGLYNDLGIVRRWLLGP